MKQNNFKNILTSQTKLKNFLKEEHLYLKKRYGQNFLFDRNIIFKILNAISFKKKQVVEIGPGIGNLTLFYYQLPEQIFLIEIDKGFNKVLQNLFSKSEHVSIIHADFLKYSLSEIMKLDQKYIIISNLPYNSGSQILVKILNYYDYIEKIYVMVPDIYTRKLISTRQKFDNKLGVLLNLFFRIKMLFPVSKNCFFPVPEVDSAFMELTPEQKIDNPEKVKEILFLLFKQKRKKLGKILKKFEKKNALIPYYDKRIDEITLKEVIFIINNFII